MEAKRPFIPIEMEVFRGRRWLLRWAGVLTAALVVLLLIWLVYRSPEESSPQASAPGSAAQVAGPPWRMGNPEGRFTLTLYADLECPFCRAYLPVLKRWVHENADVALQWHHFPLAAHEPAASAEARLAECAAEGGGHAAFWQAVEWVYAHTRSDGQGLPNGLRYPEPTPAMEQCMASEQANALIRAQAADAAKSGVAATPSLLLHDRETGKTILLQGPVEGDALLSALDMLAAGDLGTVQSTEAPVEAVGNLTK